MMIFCRLVFLCMNDWIFKMQCFSVEFLMIELLLIIIQLMVQLLIFDVGRQLFLVQIGFFVLKKLNGGKGCVSVRLVLKKVFIVLIFFQYFLKIWVKSFLFLSRFGMIFLLKLVMLLFNVLVIVVWLKMQMFIDVRQCFLFVIGFLSFVLSVGFSVRLLIIVGFFGFLMNLVIERLLLICMRLSFFIFEVGNGIVVIVIFVLVVMCCVMIF